MHSFTVGLITAFVALGFQGALAVDPHIRCERWPAYIYAKVVDPPPVTTRGKDKHFYRTFDVIST